MSRAALLAASAALVGVAACGTSVAPPYGLPPLQDASVDAEAGGAGGAISAGATGAAAMSSPADAGTDRSVGPVSGAVALVPRKPVH